MRISYGRSDVCSSDLDRHGLCLWLRLLFSDRHWRFQNEFGSGRSRDFFKHWFGIDLFNAEFAFRADEIKDVGNVAAWHADWKPILPFQISRRRIEGIKIGNLVHIDKIGRANV